MNRLVSVSRMCPNSIHAPVDEVNSDPTAQWDSVNNLFKKANSSLFE